MTINVLFVCLGNICSSPTAEGVFQKLVTDAGLTARISVDSAGTAGWHQGRAPDSRTIAVAQARGYDLSKLRAREVNKADFAGFDYILAMDAVNLQDLNRLKPNDYQGRLALLLDYGSQNLKSRKKFREVPDPYHGTKEDFELVLDLVEDAAQGLLESIRQQHKL